MNNVFFKNKMNFQETECLDYNESKIHDKSAGEKRKLTCRLMFKRITCFALVLGLMVDLCSLPMLKKADAKEIQNDEVFNELENERIIDLSGGMLEPQFSFKEVTEHQDEIDSQTSYCVSGNDARNESFPGESISANEMFNSQDGEICAEQATFAIEKDAVDYLRNQLVNRNSLIQFTYITSAKMDASKVRDLVAKAYADDLNGAPNEGDYLYWHIRSMHYQLGKKSKNTYLIRLNTTFLSDSFQEKYVASEIEKIVQELDLLSSNKTDYEKIKAVYDYLIGRIEYDHANYSVNASTYLPMYAAYSGLRDGKTVCQGYASLTYRICKRIGIPARLIAGKGMSERHGWNIVKLGDSFYNIDVTWDDEGKTTSYKYFMKSMDDFPNHTRFAEYTGAAFDNMFNMAKYSLTFTNNRYNMGNNRIQIDNVNGVFKDLYNNEFNISSKGKLRLFIFINPENNTYYQAMGVGLRNGNYASQCEVTVFDVFQHYEKYKKTTYDMMSNLDNYLNMYVSARIIPSTPETLKLKNTYEKLTGNTQTTEGAYVIIDNNNKIRYCAPANQGIFEIGDVVSDLAKEASGTSSFTNITGFSVTQKANDKVYLSWNPVAGADTYLVYRKDPGKNYICLGTTANTNCINRFKIATNYSYKVLALKSKTVIAKSDEKSVVTTQMFHSKGTKYKYAGNVYKVLTSTANSKTVAFTGLVNKKTKNVFIPETVEIDGIVYLVTQIAPKACNKNSNIKTVIVGSNVSKIGASAFESCKNISAIRIKGKKIKSIGKKALKNTSSKLLVNVPSSKTKSYKNMLKKAGLSKSAKVSK